jgi:nitrate reductase cytochrome c-type subunit
MKKILTILLLMVVSTNVLSDWTKVSDSSHANRTTYVEYHTLLKKENKVKMTSLTDFKKAEKYGDHTLLSMVTRDEYDCEKNTIRLLEIYGYSGNMQSGDIVLSDERITGEAQSIKLGTSEETFFEIACHVPEFYGGSS